jgi:hypothetical protein
MRNLLALLGLLLVVFLGVGYYRGWYDLSSAPSSSPGHRRYQLDVNAKKIEDDVERGGKAVGAKVHDLIDKGSDGLKDAKRP